MALLQGLVKKLTKLDVPCFITLIKDTDGNPKFIEVIVKRPQRYTDQNILKRVPKMWKGIRIKAI